MQKGSCDACGCAKGRAEFLLAPPPPTPVGRLAEWHPLLPGLLARLCRAGPLVVGADLTHVTGTKSNVGALVVRPCLPKAAAGTAAVGSCLGYWHLPAWLEPTCLKELLYFFTAFDLQRRLVIASPCTRVL